MSTKTLTFKKTQTIAGKYYLRKVAGTTSSIKLNADFTFDFFYSYSAIDRSGSGTYIVKDNRVILDSPQHSEKDFKLKSSKHNLYKGITIKIIDNNPAVARYVSCSIATAAGIKRAQADDNGIAQFPKQQADSIILIHLLFPDRISVFRVTDKSHNYFEFTVEPTIVNVYFNNLSLKISKKDLIGGHPLIEGEQFHYTKE